MTRFADDDVVMHGNAQRVRHRDDLLRHRNVGVRRRRIARRMIVHEDDGGRRQLQRALDHFARINRSMIDGADLLHFVGDELIALVEKQYAQLLPVGKSLRGAAIVKHGRPR